MPKYIDKSALVAEIEKMLQEEYPCDNPEQTTGYHCALYELQDFLNTLEVKEVQEETVSEDLEQAADEYSDRILSENRGKYNPDWNTYADGYEESICAHVYPAFIDGAKWQKEQEYTCYEEAFEDGCKWQKEQMMKDAVERVNKKMITRAIAWVEWNNRNGSCLFDGWKESLMEAMKGE